MIGIFDCVAIVQPLIVPAPDIVDQRESRDQIAIAHQSGFTGMFPEVGMVLLATLDQHPGCNALHAQRNDKTNKGNIEEHIFQKLIKTVLLQLITFTE